MAQRTYRKATNVARLAASIGPKTVDKAAVKIKAAPVQHERKLQMLCVDYLWHALPEGAAFNHPANERINPTKGGIHLLYQSGVQPGWPDLEIIWQSRFHAIELKADLSERGLSDNQKYTHNWLGRATEYLATADSLEDLETVLRLWGIPLDVSVAQYRFQMPLAIIQRAKLRRSRQITFD